MGNIMNPNNSGEGGAGDGDGRHVNRSRRILITSWSNVRAERVGDECENGHYFNGHFIPEDVIEVILSHLEAKDILAANQACSVWKNITTTTSFWKLFYEKKDLVKEWSLIPEACKRKDNSWILFYMLAKTNLLNINLIKNPNGEYGFNHWSVEGGFTRWRTEDPPNGSPLIPESSTDSSQSCFATSYSWAQKSQSVDLYSYGLNSQVLKLAFPFQFIVSELHGTRFDCGGEYRVDICLRGKNNDIVYDDQYHYNQSDTLLEGLNWTEFHRPIVFSEDERFTVENIDQLRFILYQHRGKDNKFWAGHYGTKFARTSIRFQFLP